MQKSVSRLLPPQLIGPLFILFSTVFYASHGVWSKALMPYFDALSSSWSRSLIVVAILLPLLLIRREFVVPNRGERWWLAVIIIPGSFVTPLYFYSFENLNVGVATLVFFTCYTLGTLVYGKFFFGELLGRMKIAALLLGLTGLGLVSSPYLQLGHLWAVAACMVAGFAVRLRLHLLKNFLVTIQAITLPFYCTQQRHVSA